MKKILLLMALALPLVFISCDNDNNEPDIPDSHEYVDLGLPSGTLWATCNVGANAPEEYGDYFAWGETSPKDIYNWNTYKWVRWNLDSVVNNIHYVSETWFKYYFKNWTSHGFVNGDGKTELDPKDDAATVNWGKRWHMPSLEQMQELVEKCDWLWTQYNGVYGRLATGPNGNSIFFPAAGGYGDKLYYDGDCGYYWSRTLCSPDRLKIEAADQENAYILFIDSWRKHIWYDTRSAGKTVRAVRESRK